MKIIVGISGASGVIYGIRILQLLREQDGIETHLIMSNYGRMNIELETDMDVKAVEALADVVHSSRNQAACISSGSFRSDGMIVAPCSMKTLSAIANSYTESLIARAADVMLKERRTLILMPRESPLHAGHCELLHKAAQLGAVIAPPMPAFYTRPSTLEELIDHTVGRVLDLFGIDTGTVKRWQGADSNR